MATLKSNLSLHILTFEDAIELALDKSLWRLLVANGAWCMPNNDGDMVVASEAPSHGEQV